MQVWASPDDLAKICTVNDPVATLPLDYSTDKSKSRTENFQRNSGCIQSNTKAAVGDLSICAV